MNRIEILRNHIDKTLMRMPNLEAMKHAYIHLYGVAQFCVLIALKRGEDEELATMAGMLHDIYTYTYMDYEDHARKGSVLAEEILTSLKITTKEETNIICDAILTHSKKRKLHGSFNELLKDADVLQHCLYDPLAQVIPKEEERFEKLKVEFGIIA